MKMDMTVKPMKPHTTEGIAASSSITTFRISFNRAPQNSDMKIAPPKLNGTAMVIAKIATLKVPKMMRAAPKLAGSCVGSHFSDVNSSHTLKLPLNNSPLPSQNTKIKMANTNTTALMPQMRMIHSMSPS